MTFTSLFADRKPMIGMVHLLPLPETPGFGGDLNAIYRQAQADAEALIAPGFCRPFSKKGRGVRGSAPHPAQKVGEAGRGR